ncbi:MAG: hypothetical protein KAU26_05960 [Methylococcales bacterium]|nr:hypothetical protein [Methylococcales bacterium]
MFKIKALILFLSFSTVSVSVANAENCLALERNQNRLTFFYDKKNQRDRPYFYVKVQTTENKTGQSLNFEEIKSLKKHLVHISNASPRQYEIPKNAEKLYIVKSSSKLNFFAYSTQIIPSTNTIKNRGASNHPKLLPREKIGTGQPTLSKSSINVCEFSL